MSIDLPAVSRTADGIGNNDLVRADTTSHLPGAAGAGSGSCRLRSNFSAPVKSRSCSRVSVGPRANHLAAILVNGTG